MPIKTILLTLLLLSNNAFASLEFKDLTFKWLRWGFTENSESVVEKKDAELEKQLEMTENALEVAEKGRKAYTQTYLAMRDAAKAFEDKTFKLDAENLANTEASKKAIEHIDQLLDHYDDIKSARYTDTETKAIAKKEIEKLVAQKKAWSKDTGWFATKGDALSPKQVKEYSKTLLASTEKAKDLFRKRKEDYWKRYSKFNSAVNKASVAFKKAEKKYETQKGKLSAEQARFVFDSAVRQVINDGELAKLKHDFAFANLNELAQDIKTNAQQMQMHIANSAELDNAFKNTPIGTYVNKQISRGLSAMCDLKNKCSNEKDAVFGEAFKILNNTSRHSLKINDIKADPSKTEKAETK